MEKYFYFYDLNEVLIDRYPSQISLHIASEINKNNFIFIYSEKYNNSIPQNIPKASKAFYIKVLSKTQLDIIIKQYPPNSLTTIAQRIPDMWMLTYFNHLSVPTFIVQHGLWSDKLERIPLIQLLFGKYSKFINYLKHVSSICKLNNIPLLITLFDLYRFLLKENINIPNTKYLHNDLLRASKAFVFDESWNDYYVKKYGYDLDNLIYIGNPDLQLIKNRDISNKEDAVCYLCQSLVEDGRYTLKEYANFLKILNSSVASSKKLYVKLHPRSKKEYYNVFDGNSNVIFTNDLPICEYYIAHYTGLLATVRYISENILIWDLPNHHIPEYFRQFGSVVTSSKDDLVSFICNKKQKLSFSPETNKEEMKISIQDPIKIIAESIIKYSKI